MNHLLLALALAGCTVLGMGAVLGIIVAQMIPGSGGQTPRRPDQQYTPATNPTVAPGSTNVVRARLVLVSGSGEGVYVYSGPPAAGDLIDSTSQGGTDPFTNITLAGTAAYGSGFAAALTAGELGFYLGSLSGGWTLQGELLISLVDGHLIINFGTAEAAGNLTVDGNLTVSGTTISAGGVSAINFDVATIDIKNGNINLNMASPPNYPTSGKTLAQTQACLDGLLGSMINRQLVA